MRVCIDFRSPDEREDSIWHFGGPLKLSVASRQAMMAILCCVIKSKPHPEHVCSCKTLHLFSQSCLGDHYPQHGIGMPL